MKVQPHRIKPFVMLEILQNSLAKLQTNPLRFEVMRNAGVAMVVKVLSMVTMLLLEFFIARILGVEQFGVYTFVLVWVLTLTIIGTLGFNTSSIRFISEYYDKNNHLVKGFLSFALLTALLSSLILTGSSIALVKWLEKLNQIDAVLADVFYTALPLIPFYSVLFVQSGILRGGKYLTLSLFFQNVFVYALLLLTILIGFYTRTVTINVKMIFLLFYIALLITLVIQQIAIKVKFKVNKNVKRKFIVSDWLNTSLSMMLSSSFQQLINRLDIIAIGILIAPTATGVYAIALRFSRLINIGLQITNESSAHLFQPLYKNKETTELQKLVFTTAKITLFTTIPLIALLMSFPSWILSQYGEEFASGALLLQILLVGQIVNVFSGPNGLLLNMTAFQNVLARIYTITLIVDIVLLVILLSTLGVIGAAIATTAVIVLRNLITIWFVVRNLRLNPTVLSSHAWRRAPS